MVHNIIWLVRSLLRSPLCHLLPDTGKGPRSLCTLEASPGSFSGPELECLERRAADKPTFSHRDWK